MPTSASPLELRINLHNDFACLTHVTLAFNSGFPMMPRLDRPEANMRSLLLSEFEDPRVCAAEDQPPCPHAPGGTFALILALCSMSRALQDTAASVA